ncbi:FecR family protein [Sphingobium sp.]|uniref:FecR family protein n=1 Tax=Sphingobium sp. TaxID=1912891 RepID=UPI003B3AAFA4
MPLTSPAPSSPQAGAAYWRAAMESDMMNADRHRMFEDWLDAAPENRAAWQKSSAIWALFDEADDPHLRAMHAAALSARPARRLRPVARIAAAVAGLCAIAATVLAIGMKNDVRSAAVATTDQTQTFDHKRYATQRGERLNATLPDGSTLTLDTDTVVDVAFSRTTRSVRLVKGQALFEVAKRPDWPFVVGAGDHAVKALGTVFDISYQPSGLKIMLVEGRVAIDTGKSARGRRPEPVLLDAGQSLTSAAHMRPVVARFDVDNALLWQKGLIAFEDVALGDAIGQINRYSQKQLSVRDPGVAALHISGIFRTGSAEQFVNNIAEILPVQPVDTQMGIEIKLKTDVKQ